MITANNYRLVGQYSAGRYRFVVTQEPQKTLLGDIVKESIGEDPNGQESQDFLDPYSNKMTANRDRQFAYSLLADLQFCMDQNISPKVVREGWIRGSVETMEAILEAVGREKRESGSLPRSGGDFSAKFHELERMAKSKNTTPLEVWRQQNKS